MAVAVEIPDGHRGWTIAGGIALGGLEGAVAVAQEHAHRAVGKIIRNRQVGVAVAVEIAHRHRIGRMAAVVVDGGLEGAVAVAQQHAHRARCWRWPRRGREHRRR